MGENKEFLEIVHSYCKVSQNRPQDVIKCLGGLYHEVSKHHHGNDGVYIHEDQWAPGERIALAAIFKYCSIPFQIFDKKGQEIPNPYEVAKE